MNTTKEGRKSPLKPFIMGLALGALAGMLGMYLHQSGKEAPQPIRAEVAAAVECPPQVAAQAAEPTARSSKDPEDYEFYGVLEKVPVTPARPDLDQPLPPPPAEGGRPAPPPVAAPAPAQTAATPPSQPRPLHLQVASFQAEAEADALQARIVLAGVAATVVAMEIPERGTYYRVRVGPFSTQDELTRAKNQLGQNDIDLSSAFVVR